LGIDDTAFPHHLAGPGVQHEFPAFFVIAIEVADLAAGQMNGFVQRIVQEYLHRFARVLQNACQAAQSRLVAEHFLLRRAFRDLIAKHQHHAGDDAAFGADGGTAVGDRPFGSVSGNEQGMVGQPHHYPFAQHALHRVFDRGAGVFVDDSEDIDERLTASFGFRPAGPASR